MTPSTVSYKFYMLRLWQEKAHGGWRASLSNINTGELRYFPNVTTLFAYICQQVDQPNSGKTKPEPNHQSVDQPETE